MLALLGRFAARRRYAILLAWAGIAVAGAVFGGAVYDRTQSVDGLRPDAESTVARERINRLAPRGEVIVAVIAGRDFYATDLVDSASRVMFEIRAIPGVASVTDEYTRPAGMVAPGNRGSLVTVELTRASATPRRWRSPTGCGRRCTASTRPSY